MYAQKSTSAAFSEQFVTACQQRDRAMGLLEMLDETAPTERRQAVAALLADGSVGAREEAARSAQSYDKGEYC